ncbi:MAG: LysE family translocator [Flavobacteriaceae bacterium]|jgi:threonine/homoserine/homoserine lactone efflux protein|nr:LysE family translocator [Flavobacteriaceae bacterium]
MTTEVLYTFFITCFLLIITPGPDLLYVISQSIVKGEKYGRAVVIGQAGGLLFHLLLFAFGISTLITKSELVFTAVKIVGACYLLWLSYKVFKEENALQIKQNDDNSLQQISFWSSMRKGLLMNMMNPKVMMFFLALFPSFVSGRVEYIKQEILILGSVFITETILVSFVICAVAAQLTSYVQGNKFVNLSLKWLQIAVFSTLALYLLFS